MRFNVSERFSFASHQDSTEARSALFKGLFRKWELSTHIYSVSVKVAKCDSVWLKQCLFKTHLL